MNAEKHLRFFRLLAGVLMVLMVAGCATSDLSTLGNRVNLGGVKGFLGLSQYYVKSQTGLWNRPDRSSGREGTLTANTRVTEITRDDLGWSKVRTVDTNLEGWLPTALLSENPVSSGLRSTGKISKEPARRGGAPIQKEPQKATTPPSKPQPEGSGEKAEQEGREGPPPAPDAVSSVPSESETTVQGDSSKPSGDSAKGGLLEVTPADAATSAPAPPPYNPPTERKGRPEYFEPF